MKTKRVAKFSRLWDKRGVRGSAVTDVVKVWAWAVGSLLIGLWLTPVAFNGGKALSELSATKDFNGVVNKFAAWSGAAGLEDFFLICWPIAAVVLFLPMIEWLGIGSGSRGKSPWQIRLPYGAGTGQGAGQAIAPNPWGLLHGLVGFLLTFGCFLVIGFALVKAGLFAWSGKVWSEGLWFDIGWALIVAMLIEVFFRRVVLGVFLRAMGVGFAICLTGLMFASVQFILSGFGNAAAVDGETLTAFHLTGILFAGGDLWERFVIVFLPWFALGCVLGIARWRTASLWLSSGLLTGWLLADRLFLKAAYPVEIPDRVAAYFAAESLHNGIVPLLGVVVIGGLVHVITYGTTLRDEVCD